MRLNNSSKTPATPVDKRRDDNADDERIPEENGTDAKDEWQENEPIEMQPLVKEKEAARSNRRSKVPV